METFVPVNPINRTRSYYGCKAAYVDQIVPEFGTFTMFADVFCGSLAVSFAAPPCADHKANDLSGDAINLCWVLQSARFAELRDRLERTGYAEALHDWARNADTEGGTLPTGPDDVGPEHVEWAWRVLVRDWQGRNGTAGTKRTNITHARRFTPDGGGGVQRWLSVVHSLQGWRDRLMHIQVIRSDAFDLIGKYADDPRVCIYADPPYVRATRGRGGTSTYNHDVPTTDQEEREWHARLAAALGRFKRARVLVSYYDHPWLRELYQGWTWRELRARSTQGNTNRRDLPGIPGRSEWLIINGPSFVDNHGPLFA